MVVPFFFTLITFSCFFMELIFTPKKIQIWCAKTSIQSDSIASQSLKHFYGCLKKWLNRYFSSIATSQIWLLDKRMRKSFRRTKIQYFFSCYERIHYLLARYTTVLPKLKS